MNGRNPQIDEFLNSSEKWKEEFEQLREIILDCGLDEEFKWYKPCYTYQNKNIVLIHGFKEYCAMLFFKGALLQDPDGILIQQTENVQAARQIRFTSVREIVNLKTELKNYINAAIEVEKSGTRVKLKETVEYQMPEEFRNRLDRNPTLKTAFESLTQGRQRAYIFYFSSAKQAKTREMRIDKYTNKILDGKGLND